MYHTQGNLQSIRIDDQHIDTDSWTRLIRTQFASKLPSGRIRKQPYVEFHVNSFILYHTEFPLLRTEDYKKWSLHNMKAAVESRVQKNYILSLEHLGYHRASEALSFAQASFVLLWP